MSHAGKGLAGKARRDLSDVSAILLALYRQTALKTLAVVKSELSVFVTLD